MFCVYCGKEILNGAGFCAFCGKPQHVVNLAFQAQNDI
ncbi:MAG: zinc-ribbon domain-containing protein [Lachnospiraceae bacterium]|nr:zinc-ribbon domain-containing protein [Lachnospiraceae bacterium]